MITLQAKEAMEVCFTLQPETNTFRSAAVNRTSSGSGSALGRGPADSDHFLYRRQLSDGVVTAGGCLQMCSSSLSCVQEGFSSDSHSYISSSKAPPAWQQNSSIQVSSLSSRTNCKVDDQKDAEVTLSAPQTHKHAYRTIFFGFLILAEFVPRASSCARGVLLLPDSEIPILLLIKPCATGESVTRWSLCFYDLKLTI